MEFLVVTGLSGAGKTKVLGALEDIGFFCVDNIPPALISKFAELGQQSNGKIQNIAVITDLRGGELFTGLFESLDEVKKLGCDYRLLFLEADDKVLLKRFRETRRRHPLMGIVSDSIEQDISAERSLLKPTRERADYIIDTSLLSPAQLKERVAGLFAENASRVLIVNCMSFGFKYGLPTEADLVFDMRCLPNPFYVEELKNKVGTQQEVRDYVLKWPQAQGLVPHLTSMMDYLLPLYNQEGKSQLVLAVGCTGGKHRSVVFAELLAAHIRESGYRVTLQHRDILKK